MPLWGNTDTVSGNNKPLFANSSDVYGVSTTEALAANNTSKQLTPGWVQVTRGTGYLVGVAIGNAGSNIVASGFLSIGGGGSTSNANVRYTVNTVSNTVNSVSIVNPGEGFVSSPSANIANTGVGYPAQLVLTFGGRFNRNTYETLVVVKGMGGDAENVMFPNT